MRDTVRLTEAENGSDGGRESAFVAASVVVDETRRGEVRWDSSANRVSVQYRAGPQDWRSVAEGAGADRALVEGLPERGQAWFRLVTDDGETLDLAERTLRLPDAPNFRDVGGHRTQDGRWVRMGRLYRADQLDRLDADDLGVVKGLGLRLVCDLRTGHERANHPLALDAEVLNAEVLRDMTTLLTVQDRRDAVKFSAWLKGMPAQHETYRQLVSAPAALEGYREMFGRLCEAQSAPALFHCTAGKDRTGWAAAVLLSALGVPRDVVMADYLASNDYRAASNREAVAWARPKLDPDVLAIWESALSVRAQSLDAAFDEANQVFGSFEGYLREGVGLSPDRVADLREALLA